MRKCGDVSSLAFSVAPRRGRSPRKRSNRSGCGDRGAKCHRKRSARPARVAAFLQGLQELGWTDGRNIRSNIVGCGRSDNIRKPSGIGRARAGRDPGVWHRSVAPLLHATRTVPIVFVKMSDPVGAGFVQSFARPGGNFTGFLLSNMESGKWLELLKEIAPILTRAGVIWNRPIPVTGQFGAIQSVAPSSGST